MQVQLRRPLEGDVPNYVFVEDFLERPDLPRVVTVDIYPDKVFELTDFRGGPDGTWTGTMKEEMSDLPPQYTPSGIIHRGEYMIPDGSGGIIHSYCDGELIHHYKTVQELLDSLDD